MKPLVTHIRASNFFGGPERQITGHIAVCKEYRHLVITFIESDNPNEFYDYCHENSVPVTGIVTRHPFDLSSLLQLRKLLKFKKPSIICCHGYKPAILSLLAKAGLNIPMIAFARGHTGEDLKVKIFEYLERKALKFSDMVVAVSQGYAEYLKERGVSAERIRVVLNAIDINKFIPFIEQRDQKRHELGFSKDEFLIATAGRLSPEKAQKDLILAFQHVRNKFSNVQLLLCGDGSLRNNLEKLVRSCDIRNVHFLGFRKDIDEIMPAIDLFVLPSLTEGLPNVVLEAFATATPVIATAIGGVPELVIDGENGFLVPASNPDLLTKAIIKGLRSPELMKIMGRNGYEKVKTEFSLERQSVEIEGLYRSLLKI